SASTSLNLRLPSGQMSAQKSGENALAAVKSAFADLFTQVTKHKELLRGHWARKSTRRAGRGAPLQDAAPVKSVIAKSLSEGSPPPARTDTAAVSSIETWLSANLRQLEEFVDRELHFQIEQDRIREGQITRDEVIDEVIVSALSQEDGKTHLLSLERWFHRLAVAAIRRLITANADTGHLSLDAPAGIQNVTGSDENVLQYHQPNDSLPEESVIRDQSVRTPEEILAGDEMVAQLDIVLQGLHAHDREAFVLYTLEGFTVEEISRL